MNKDIDWLGRTPLETIQNRLALLESYQPAPKAEKPLYRKYSSFDDRIFPLTKYVIEQYKKLVKVNDAKLAQHLADTKIKKFDITKVQNNPDGAISISNYVNGKKIVKKISPREWFTMGAAMAAHQMLAMSSNYIYKLYQNPNESEKDRIERSKQLFAQWESFCVDFFSCFCQIGILERSKSGIKTAQNKNPIKTWVLEQARVIRAKNKTISKREIANKIFYERYNPKHWKNPLKQYSEIDTIYRWILADKSFE